MDASWRYTVNSQLSRLNKLFVHVRSIDIETFPLSRNLNVPYRHTHTAVAAAAAAASAAHVTWITSYTNDTMSDTFSI